MSFVKNLFGGPKPPPMPAPTAPPPVPTVDTARQDAESEIQTNQRKGAMADMFSPTNTGTQLSQAAPEASLKRLLGA